MERIENRTMDEERALYGQENTEVIHCRFDGPADGESAIKEGRDILVDDCFFNLRYPFWHDNGLTIQNSEMTDKCRAALWYSRNVEILHSRLHGIKALRECSCVFMEDCEVISPEFGWSVRGMKMKDCNVVSEYFMMRSHGLCFDDVRFKGKYSFQYVTDSVFENCGFDTKDAFWHTKNVTVRNSTIKGEYLAWYSENLTLENCTIIGTQPLCYCENLKLINCRMIDTDLAFERSDVRAELIEPIESIKNPLSGTIRVPAAGEILFDIEEARGKVILTGQSSKESS